MEVKSKLVIRWLGRFFLLSVFVAQAIVFAHYASKYYKNDGLYWLTVLVVPAIAAWCVVMCRKEIKDQTQMNWQWLVWLLYAICLLIPMVILFARKDFTKRLDKDDFFGPNFLKITFCGAPAVAVLLLVTAKDSQRYEGSVAQLCGSIALDLFDEIELLEILLHHDHVQFSTVIEVLIILFVCISFALTAISMRENKFDGVERVELRSYRFYRRRLIFQTVCVNVPFLVLRLLVRDLYKIDASVFIAKNVLVMVTSSLEIVRVWNRKTSET